MPSSQLRFTVPALLVPADGSDEGVAQGGDEDGIGSYLFDADSTAVVSVGGIKQLPAGREVYP